MFTLKVLNRFRKTLGAFATTSLRPKRPPNSPPRLEVLEARIVPALDTWIAPAGAAQSWDVGTNWSAMHSPAAGDTAVFSNPMPGVPGSGSNTPCFVPAGDNLPLLGQLTVGAWAGTLTLNSNLAASTVGIANRAGAGGSPDVIINSGSNLYALQQLTWNGGSVTGSGSFEVGGSDTINGLDATDKPTLGCIMNVGTTYLNNGYGGSLFFAQSSQPLVVKANANIYINVNSGLTFLENSGNGSSMTAVTNGDTLVHSIIVNGGALNRTNYCELFVCTGLDVESGAVYVRNPQGQTSGNPLHFTRPTSSGAGLLVNGGLVSLSGDFISDYYGIFQGGTINVDPNPTLTLGVNANSPISYMEYNTTFNLLGTLVPHGGFQIYSGTFGTFGSLTSKVNLDTGNEFALLGGELDITEGGTGAGAVAQGKLKINGDFAAEGGTIVDTVDSSNSTFGVFQVFGAATLTTGTMFVSKDLGTPGANYTQNWNLMTVSGALSGDFTYSLPQKWNHNWNGGTLTIQENT